MYDCIERRIEEKYCIVRMKGTYRFDVDYIIEAMFSDCMEKKICAFLAEEDKLALKMAWRTWFLVMARQSWEEKKPKQFYKKIFSVRVPRCIRNDHTSH